MVCVHMHDYECVANVQLQVLAKEQSLNKEGENSTPLMVCSIDGDLQQ